LIGADSLTANFFPACLPYIGIDKEKSAVDAVTCGTPGPKPTAVQKTAGTVLLYPPASYFAPFYRHFREVPLRLVQPETPSS
jgi:hypothetical protein